MPGKVIGRRTNFGPTAITDAIADLLRLELLVPAGFDAKGVKSYRLTLPSLDGGAERAAASASFDPLTYVDALVDDIDGIPADEVRKVVRYHLRESNKKFWADKLPSETALRKHLPTMRKQYLTKPESAAPRRGQSYVPRVADETPDDYVPMRKGEKYVRPEAA